MADLKITQLPTATTPAGTELAEIVQGGVNKKVTLQEIADLAPEAGIQSIVAGTNVTVDDSDPLNPIVSASGGGSGTVESVTGDGVDNTDPANPVIHTAPVDVFDRATASTGGGTVTFDMNSQKSRMFVGSASFSTPKTFALSNATNALQLQITFEVTNVAAVITLPSDWEMSDLGFDGTTWTPPEVGKWVFGGGYDGTAWQINVGGPYL